MGIMGNLDSKKQQLTTHAAYHVLLIQTVWFFEPVIQLLYIQINFLKPSLWIATGDKK